MKKYHFSMILSDKHLFKALSLYVSLRNCCKDFELFILCMSEKVYNVLDKIKFENITIILINDLEKNNIDLIMAKSNRSFHEYCWTVKPVFLDYIIERYKNAKYYVHVDADLFFFNNIDKIFNENSEASIFLTEHYNSREFMHYYDLTGKYNTGFLGFKNDDQGKTAIKIWKIKCLEKCTGEYDVVNKTFGDQRYVEEWPNIFKNVHVVKTIGANTAFWNVKNYRVHVLNNNIYVNNVPLIFYHFSALSALSYNEVELCSFYKIEDQNLIRLVYEPYIKIMFNVIKEMLLIFPELKTDFIDRNILGQLKNYRVIDF